MIIILLIWVIIGPLFLIRAWLYDLDLQIDDLMMCIFCGSIIGPFALFVLLDRHYANKPHKPKSFTRKLLNKVLIKKIK